ncbi:MAG TPA: YfhO family protein, partial [Thermoanaerobaculia bacterium]
TWPALLLPAALSFTYSGPIALLVAAICAFVFARELACGETASLVSAATWSLASSLVLFALVPLGATWAWAPLVFTGVRRVAREPSVRSAVLLTCAFTLMLAAGHSESALLIVILGLAYGAFELLQSRDRALRAAGFAVAAGVVALLLNAIHLLPFFDAVPHTMEYAFRQGYFQLASRGIDPRQSLVRVATNFFPYLHGRPWYLTAAAPTSFTTGATGSVALGLAIYALARIRSRTSWFFGAIALFCIVAAAEWNPIANAMGKVPLLELALFDRFGTGAAFAIAVLAALGVDELQRRAGDRTLVYILGAWLAVVVAGNLWLTRSKLIWQEDVHFGRYVVVAEVALLAAAMLAAMQRRALAPILLLLVVAQRALSAGDIQHSFPQRVAYPPIPILDATRNERTPFRIIGHGNSFVPGTSTLYGLEDPRGYSAMTLLRYRETFGLWCIEQPVWSSRADDLSRPFLSFLNVRYAITLDSVTPPAPWQTVARQRGAILLRNPRALDRAFVPRSVRVGDPANLNLMNMALASDFAARAWIEEQVPPYERANGPGRVTIRDARLGYELDATMESDGWVVTSIAAWPGWRAYIDGKRVSTQIANHAFISVHVPQGTHRIRFKYWPQSFVAGRTITAATLAAVIVFALLRHRRKPLLE